MRRSRILWLVFMAMLMFAVGTAVQATAESTADHLLGGAAIVGALAVVLANVVNGKDGHDE